MSLTASLKHRPNILLNELCDQFSDYYRIFTDGSKVGDKVAAAVVHKHNCKSVRLPNNISIFRAELYALVLAIEVVRRLKEQNFIIFSDSKSSLEAINNFQIEVDLVQKFIKEYTLINIIHLLSSTFSLNALILEIFATNTLSLPLWKTYMNKSICAIS